METSKQEAQVRQDLLTELGTEVSEESAPLLEWITKNGGKIAGAVLLFLLVTGASALWQWQTQKKNDALLDSMARITQGTARDKSTAADDCLRLADSAPKQLQGLVYLTVGALETQNKGFDGALQAYENAAKADADGTTGMMATLAHANTLLRLGKYSEAITELKQLQTHFAPNVPQILRQLEAEACVLANDNERAATIFAELSAENKGGDTTYFRARAQDLRETSSTKQPATK